jgi:hypothetical protein
MLGNSLRNGTLATILLSLGAAFALGGVDRNRGRQAGLRRQVAPGSETALTWLA